MAFLDKTGLQNLTDKLVQVGEVEVASPRGRTIKQFVDNINRECDNVANPLEYSIENTSNMFKVGEGESINVSGDAEAGFTDITTIGRSIGGFNVETGQPGGIYSSCEAEGNVVKIRTIGKNLATKNNFSFIKENGDERTQDIDLRNLEIGKTYIYKSSSNRVKLYALRQGGGHEYFVPGKQFEWEEVFNTVRIYVDTQYYENEKIVVNDFQIEEGRVATPYTPYQEDKEEIQLPCPHLEGNTYSGETGEYVESFKKNIYSGMAEEMWSCDSSGENTIRFSIAIDGKELSKGYCDTIRFVTSGMSLDKRVCGISVGQLFLRLNKLELETQDVAGFKKWLQANPTTIIYELATPITHQLKPLKLQTYEKGRIIIENEVAPKTIHKVQLNRAGQIERGVREITELKERVNKLEVHYNSQLLEAQHSLEMLDLDYKLKQEVNNGDIVR